MKSSTLTGITAVTLFAALAIPVCHAAQDNRDHNHKRRHYKLIDMGAFGGPGSFVNDAIGLVNNLVGLNRRGVAGGRPQLLHPVCRPATQPCSVTALTFPRELVLSLTLSDGKKGTITDLGALPGDTNCSIPMAINAGGEIVGISENGQVDPLTGVNETRAVRWKEGEIEDLGSFGGNQNAALRTNNNGQIVGWSLNSVPDPYSPIDLVLTSSFLGRECDLDNRNLGQQSQP
jgi:probable HAF family extracellular repeat protein